MKYHFLKLLSFSFLLFTMSCGDQETPLICDGQVLHTIEQATGTMIFLSCYEAWGVKLDTPLSGEETTIGARLDIHSDYQTEGLRVILDACFYQFDLPLVIPDPMPWGELYNMDNIGITEE